MPAISGGGRDADGFATVAAAADDRRASSEDGSIAAVLSGDLYNQGRLGILLEERGRAAATASAPELLVHLYEEFGADLVQALDGGGALAIWDGRRGELVLARDRFGERPLFYAVADGGLAFASEPTALAPGGGLAARVDRAAVAGFLAAGQVPAERSFLAGVRQLPPASTLSWRPGEPPLVRPHWRLAAPSEPGGESSAEVVAELRRVLGDSVRARLAPPPTVLLGGDLDSAVLAALASRESGAPIATLACDLDAEAAAAASAAASAVGAEHRELELGPERVAAAVPAVLGALEQPCADCSAPAAQALVAAACGVAGGALAADAGSPGLAAALGVRLPYLNRELAEFNVTLPERSRAWGRKRTALAELLSELLPKTSLRRRAATAPTPLGSWLRGPLAAPLAAQIEAGPLAAAGLIDREAAAGALREHAGGADRSTELWPILAAGLWLERRREEAA